MGAMQFRDRAEAGRLLAQRLREYASRDDVVVLGLPRGGVPVGFQVAQVSGAQIRRSCCSGVFVDQTAESIASVKPVWRVRTDEP